MKFILDEEGLCLRNKKEISLYFYAAWMPYHKKMLFMIDKVEKKYDNVYFFAIDVDAFGGICKRFNIKSIPTIVLIKNKQEVNRINGLVLTKPFMSCYYNTFKQEQDQDCQ